MAVATGVYHTNYGRDLALRHTRAEYARLALMALVVLALPFTLETYWLRTVNLIGLAAIAAVGLNILTGYTGLVSLATGAFLGVGAYTTANVSSRFGLPVPVGILAGAAVAAVIGAFFGLPALRLKGLYLAISTLAAQYILSFLFKSWRPLTAGASNIGRQPGRRRLRGPERVRLVLDHRRRPRGHRGRRRQPVPDGPGAGLHRHPRPGHRR
jgi:branched-chain amino acid transport system permease protein